MHCPGPLLSGVNLEKAGAIIAARQAVVGTANREFFFTGTHVGLAGPFTATIIIDGVDVIVTRDQCASQQRLARA